MSEEPRSVVRNLIEQCLTGGHLELIDELVAEDYIQHNPSVPPGRDGLRKLYGQLRTAFPDLVVTLDETIAEGDTVVALSTMRGTHKGEFSGIRPTGRSVQVGSMDLYRVRRGRVAEHLGRFDELGLLAQLGITHDLSWRGDGQ